MERRVLRARLWCGSFRVWPPRWHGELPALDPPPVYWTEEEGWPVLRGCRCQTDAECADKEEAQRERFAWCYREIPSGRNPGMDPDQIPPGQPAPVVTALSQEADDLRAALVADLLRVQQEALLDEVAETLAYLNLELLSTSEAVTHIVAVVDDFRSRCARILG